MLAGRFTSMKWMCVMQPASIRPGPCQRCGGELEWKTSIPDRGMNLETHCFQCKACAYVHILEREISESPTAQYVF